MCNGAKDRCFQLTISSQILTGIGKGHFQVIPWGKGRLQVADARDITYGHYFGETTTKCMKKPVYPLKQREEGALNCL